MLLEIKHSAIAIYCKSLPVYLLLDQRKLILWMKMHRSNNIVLKTLPGVNYYELIATCSKYSIDVSDMSENIIKQSIWNMVFYIVGYSVDADFWAFIFTFVCYFACFVLFTVYVYTVCYCLAVCWRNKLSWVHVRSLLTLLVLCNMHRPITIFLLLHQYQSTRSLLPLSIRSLNSFNSFESQLKTHLSAHQ